MLTSSICSLPMLAFLLHWKGAHRTVTTLSSPTTVTWRDLPATFIHHKNACVSLQAFHPQTVHKTWQKLRVRNTILSFPDELLTPFTPVSLIILIIHHCTHSSPVFCRRWQHLISEDEGRFIIGNVYCLHGLGRGKKNKWKRWEELTSPDTKHRETLDSCTSYHSPFHIGCASRTGLGTAVLWNHTVKCVFSTSVHTLGFSSVPLTHLPVAAPWLEHREYPRVHINKHTQHTHSPSSAIIHHIS